jgi:serine/threonine protein kinase
VFLAMEYVQLGDLERNVSTHSGKLSGIEARDIAEQILLGLEIMHVESFSHRDLKPQVYHYHSDCLLAFNAHFLCLIERVGRQWATRVVGKACRLRVKQEADRYDGVLHAGRHSVIYGP